PDRLTDALAEILARPNPPRRQRSYPRVLKRIGHKFPRKTLQHNNINHDKPAEICLHQRVS
ncbi:hypothetical protein, partial [Nocardia seriolae]|uniref:hypothetical protein n=1 Tax=Nocardia seriolae TaxID=37332 RepID=UPI001C7CBFA6